MSSPSLIEPSKKIRKLRKGTYSCWECKRRKARCHYLRPEDAMCVRCAQRGMNCISQKEEDEQSYIAKHAPPSATDRRLVQIETMLEQLVHGNALPRNSGPKQDAPQLEHFDYTKYSTIYNANRDEAKTSIPRGLDTTISNTLYTLFPTQREANLLCSRDEFAPCLFQQMLARDFMALSAAGATPSAADIATIPKRDAHPVTIAQKMLLFAILTQFGFLHSKASSIAATGKERVVASATAAMELVLREDGFVRSVEGLECMMLQVLYFSNCGDLQSAFVAVRRAIAIAQLLGIHRSTHRVPQGLASSSFKTMLFDPSYLWRRIVTVDRTLSLMLGVPAGCSDITAIATSFGSSDVEDKMEGQHSSITSRILARNDDDHIDWETVERIDESLQVLSASMPVEWWHVSDLSPSTDRADVFLATNRLVNQIFHFNLINQLHLPYLLKESPTDECRSQYSYSRSCCISSGREILHRHAILQQSSLAVFAYQTTDFFAFIAAVTLILAHIERSWLNKKYDDLAHTRVTDRSIIEKAIDYIKKEPLIKRGECGARETMRNLLDVEEEAYTCSSVGSGSIVRSNLGEPSFFELNIPFLGIFRIDAERVWLEKRPEIRNVSSRIGLRSVSPPEQDNLSDFRSHMVADPEFLEPENRINGITPNNIDWADINNFLEDADRIPFLSNIDDIAG